MSETVDWVCPFCGVMSSDTRRWRRCDEHLYAGNADFCDYGRREEARLDEIARLRAETHQMRGSFIAMGLACGLTMNHEQPADVERAVLLALTERATLVEAARAVLAESSHDMPPSLGALDALRVSLTETTNGRHETRAN